MEVVGSSTCDKSGSDRPMSWLLTNYHSTTERLFQTMPALENLRSQRAELGNNVKRLMNLVITPSSVPDFTIPQTYRSGLGSLQARQGSTDSLTSLVDYSPSASRVPKRRNSESSSGSNSPELSNNNNGSHPRQPRSQPASPKLLTPMKNKGLFRRSHTISYEMIDECREPATTNADPRSLAAMSLPHLKTKTKFGFETLSECPKTERRESLFHNQNYSLKNSNQAWKLSVLNGLSSKRCGTKQGETSSTDDSKASLEHLRRTRSKRRNVHSQVAPLGVAISPQDSLESNASSCGNSPIPSRTSSLDRNSPLASGLAEKRKRFSSKRSATVGQDGMKTILANNKQNPQTPNDSRRGSCLNNNVSLNEEDVQQLLRLSAMTCTVQAGASNSFPGAMGSIGFEDQNRLAALVTSQKQVTRGELKFSLEYSQAKQQLRVHLQEGVSLSNGQLTGTEGINAFVKLSINTQRFTSNVIRNTNNPVFDKAFTFRDISPEQLCEHKLRIKVLHREGLLKRNELLGSLDVNLAIIINCSQPRLELRRELETEYIPRELGRLQVKIDFQPNSEKLEVTVMKIKDLPCNTITGAPDPYVVLELRQPGRPDVRLQTGVKKKVTTANMNETFLFHISPRIEDLNYTCLSLSVYDHEMIRSDRFIGEVRLGFGATEQSEFDHWNQVLNTPGKEFANWHMLMEEQ